MGFLTGSRNVGGQTFSGRLPGVGRVSRLGGVDLNMIKHIAI